MYSRDFVLQDSSVISTHNHITASLKIIFFMYSLSPMHRGLTCNV